MEEQKSEIQETSNTLDLRKSIKKLHAYVESIYNIFDWPQYITLQVLLQNLYGDDKLTEDKCNKYLLAIKKLSAYREDDHVIKFVCENLEMDIIGHYMQEFENKK